MATVATVAQLRVMVRAARPAPKPDPGDEPTESVAGWFDDDGRYHLRGELDPDHGRIVDAALSEARDALFHDGQAERVVGGCAGGDRPPLVGRGAGGAAGTVPGQLVHRPGRSDPGPLRDGLAVPDWLRDQLLCDGTVTPTFTANGRPVSVGRTQHQVPDRTRRLVVQRDRKCRVPWCGQTRWLQVHHIIHDHHHGPTDTWNLTALCPADHRLHHQGRLGITGDADDPDGLTFTDAHGRVIDPATRPIKPTGPPPSRPGQTLRTPPRRTTPTPGHPLPRPPTRLRRLTALGSAA